MTTENALYLLVGFAITALGIYLKSYFTKSGELQAIKEGLEEVTRITESIKTELDITTKNKLRLQEVGTETLLILHNALSEFFQELVFFPWKYPERFDETLKQVELYRKNCIIVKSKFLLLYSKEEKAIKSFFNLYNEVNAYRKFVKRNVEEIKRSNTYPKSDDPIFKSQIKTFSEKIVDAEMAFEENLKRILDLGISAN